MTELAEEVAGLSETTVFLEGVTDLLEQMFQLHRQREEKTKDLQGEHDELCEKLRHVEWEMSELTLDENEQLEQMEAQVKNLMLGVGKTVQTAFGEATFQSGYERITYNAKNLDVIWRADPLKYRFLGQNRKATRVKPNIRVGIYKERREDD